jgi:anthranilate synthase/aminodeoxychorismate synthase-like glutamine amidotransferase
MKKKIILIDNYDSFTYNLVQGFLTLGAEVLTYRNDDISINEAKLLNPSHIVISPGPGNPSDSGISMAIIEAFHQTTPILGVCLGHQCIVKFFGGEIINAQSLIHGKSSKIHHDQRGVLSNISNPMEAGRYHSLAANPKLIPSCLTVTAKTDDGEIMGVRHTFLPLEGVQFHPESILTPDGLQLMKNFIEIK